MVESDISPGTYAIRPKDGPQDRYLIIAAHPLVEPPLPEILVDLGSDRFPWVLKDTGNHTTVHAQGYAWIIKDSGDLAVSNTGEGVGLIFRRDVTGFVTIDDPGFVGSRRLTFHKDAHPLFTFQEANNSSAQLFEVIKIKFD